MSRTIAIGDVHGCAKSLKFLVEEKIGLEQNDRLILLGDYVNKGPDSKGVIDYVINLKKTGYNVDALRGNHDQLMLEAWKEPTHFDEWIERGGDATLESFGCSDLADIPMSYYSFLSTTSYFVETDHYLLVHAGFNFDSADIFEDLDAMLTIREMEVDLSRTEGKKIIHGHVPLELEQVKSQLKQNWKEISIDTGCVYTDQANKAYLSALILETQELLYTENQE